VENIQCLTIGIPVPHMDDIPLRIERNVMGVGNRFGRLLQKAARVVIFYNEYRYPHDECFLA